MKLKYLANQQPPTCLHILGQGLVEAIHTEGLLVKSNLDALIAQADAQFKAGDTHATFSKQTIDSLRYQK